MFSNVSGKWEQTRIGFISDVKDSFGSSIDENLFQVGGRIIDSMERQYEESEQEKNSIECLLSELRSIV